MMMLILKKVVSRFFFDLLLVIELILLEVFSKKEEQRSQSRLLLFGGDYRGISSEALIMQQVALDQGVARDKIILETVSWDTADQARSSRDHLGQTPFYLGIPTQAATRI